MWTIVDTKGGVLCLKSDKYTLGPFFFTKENVGLAQLAALDKDILPFDISLVEVSLDGLEETLEPDNNLDVISIDGVQFPLSAKGAKALDAVGKDTFWGNILKRSDWRRIVIAGIQEVLGEDLLLDIEIGEHSPHPSRENLKKVKNAVHIEILTTEEGSYPLNDSEYDGASVFTVTTRGLATLGHPEIQFQYVPGLFLEEAGAQLLFWGALAIADPLTDGRILTLDEPFRTTLKCRQSLEGFVLTPETIELDSEEDDLDLSLN